MTNRWSLRTGDGSIFGPVEWPLLVAWAEDGRIGPRDAVAPEGGEWIEAQRVPLLGMDWIVQTADGAIFGPVHLHAMRELWRANQIIPRTKIVQLSTGKAFDAADLLVRILLEREERDTRSEPAVERQPAVWRELQDAVDKSNREISHLNSLYRDERNARKQLVEEHLEMQGVHRKEILAANLEVEDLRKRLKAAQAASSVVASAAMLEAGKLDNASLVDSVRRLTRNFQEADDRAAKLEAELREARVQLDEARHRVDTLPGAMERQLAALRDEVAAEKSKYTELERTHADILRQFRELNDRYLRTLQTAKTPPPIQRP